MNDIWEPTLTDKIHVFLDRKTRKYPELKILEKWGRYEYILRHQDRLQTIKFIKK